MSLQCPLEIEYLIPPLAIVDEELLSRLVSDPLRPRELLIDFWLESQTLCLLAHFLALDLPYQVFLLFSLLECHVVEAFSIVDPTT